MSEIRRDSTYLIIKRNLNYLENRKRKFLVTIPSPDDFDKIIEMRSNSQDFEDITMRYRERKAEFEVQMDGLRSQRAELEKQLFI